MDTPLVIINVKQWGGLVTNASPHKLPPGAGVVHENLRCQVPGQMDVRPGHRTANVTSPDQVINVVTYPSVLGDKILVHAVDGSVSALTPS